MLAEPGDVVTCPFGHPVWTVVEEVQIGAAKTSAFRCYYTGKAPLPGVAPPCPACGGPIVAYGGEGRYTLCVQRQPLGPAYRDGAPPLDESEV